MRKYLIGAVIAAALPMTVSAKECGEVSITDMDWASSAIVTQVAKFLMEQGYGCTVITVPSGTLPAVTSVSENGEPDIVTEMWTTGGGAAYEKLRDQGRVVELGQVITPGGVDGWWIPTYLAEAHPELTTIEGILANPELVGRFNNCPDGWTCRIINDNLVRAYGLEDAGIEVFNHGSGETLATSIAAAYDDKEPWFGYYWGPSMIFGKYPMTQVNIGPVDKEAHRRNQEADRANPEPSGFPAAPVYTVVTADFQVREPEVADLMSKMTFTADAMSALLAWQTDSSASAEEAAVHFLLNNKETWAEWLNDDARARLSAVLQ